MLSESKCKDTTSQDVQLFNTYLEKPLVPSYIEHGTPLLKISRKKQWIRMFSLDPNTGFLYIDFKRVKCMVNHSKIPWNTRRWASIHSVASMFSKFYGLMCLFCSFRFSQDRSGSSVFKHPNTLQAVQSFTDAADICYFILCYFLVVSCCWHCFQ